MKKKSSKKRFPSRRRKSSGVGAVDVMGIVGVIVGASASALVDKFAPATIDKRIVLGGKIALGIALPMFVKDGKTKNILASVGSGMIAVSTADLIKTLGIISGSEDNELLEVDLSGSVDVLSGDDDISVVNGDNDSVLAGDEDLSIINGFGDDDEDSSQDEF